MVVPVANLEQQAMARGWGRATSNRATLAAPAGDEDWAGLLTAAGPKGVIARGGGDAPENVLVSDQFPLVAGLA